MRVAHQRGFEICLCRRCASGRGALRVAGAFDRGLAAAHAQSLPPAARLLSIGVDLSVFSARQETRFFFAGLCPVDPAFDPRALPFVQTFFYTVFYHCLSHVSAMAGHTAPELCSLQPGLGWFRLHAPASAWTSILAPATAAPCRASCKPARRSRR